MLKYATLTCYYILDYDIILRVRYTEVYEIDILV